MIVRLMVIRREKKTDDEFAGGNTTLTPAVGEREEMVMETERVEWRVKTVEVRERRECCLFCDQLLC